MHYCTNSSHRSTNISPGWILRRCNLATLADLIAFNQAHKDRELIVFGQEIFEMAQECGPVSEEKYQKGRAGLDRAVDTDGARHATRPTGS